MNVPFVDNLLQEMDTRTEGIMGVSSDTFSWTVPRSVGHHGAA